MSTPVAPSRVHFVSAEDRYHAYADFPEHTPAEAVVFRFWRHHAEVPGPQRMQMKGPMPVDVLDTPVAVAYVNHGRWMVDCPFEGCGSAQYSSRIDHRFFCIECANGGTNAWVRVTWPSDVDVAAIEATLDKRPAVDRGQFVDPRAPSRNWDPRSGETVADLEAENEVHGL